MLANFNCKSFIHARDRPAFCGVFISPKDSPPRFTFRLLTLTPFRSYSEYVKSQGAYAYSIRVQGLLDPSWSEWFAGMKIRSGDKDETILDGPIPDQAALYGLLNKLSDLNLTLLAIDRIEPPGKTPDILSSD